MSWDFLKSRGFWVALSSTVGVLCTVLGVAEETTALILAAVAAWGAFFVVGEVRKRVNGGQRSYAEIHELLRKQAEEIRTLEGKLFIQSGVEGAP